MHTGIIAFTGTVLIVAAIMAAPVIGTTGAIAGTGIVRADPRGSPIATTGTATTSSAPGTAMLGGSTAAGPGSPAAPGVATGWPPGTTRVVIAAAG